MISCDFDYFKEIDNKDKSYWLGFLYADGYVRIDRKNSAQFKLKLSSKDRDHIERFKKSVKSDHLIKDSIESFVSNGKSYTSNASTLNIFSSTFVKNLISQGCVNNKTQKITLPNLRADLMSHFIRGYFDGDGHISKIKNRPNSYTFSICSNHRFIGDMLKFLEMGSIIKKKTTLFYACIRYLRFYK